MGREVLLCLLAAFLGVHQVGRHGVELAAMICSCGASFNSGAGFLDKLQIEFVVE